MRTKDPEKAVTPAAESVGYEPPLVERVMDADELGREVLYAGRAELSP